MIVFLDTTRDGTGKFIHPGDTVKNNINQPIVCPFHIIQLETGAGAYYMVYEPIVALRGIWDDSDYVMLRSQWSTHPLAYDVSFHVTHDLRPVQSDTLWLFTEKTITASDTLRFTASDSYVVGVTRTAAPADFSISQNYPNPFNPQTSFRVRVPEGRIVRLKVFDLLGREIAVVFEGYLNKGEHTLRWNAARYTSGVYFCRFEAGSYTETKRLVLLK